jgi:DNA polymerase-3 subunit epsilon
LARYADRRYPHEIAGRFGALAGLTLAQLHAAQVGWYAEQSLSFANYLRRKARELALDQGVEDPAEQAAALLRRADEVSTDWPMRPWTGGPS